jgi:hypothetical protein
MTPHPVSPKKFKGSDFPEKPVLRRQTNCSSVLCKRTFQFAFDVSDDERYGQHIGDDFFKINIGHDVRQTSHVRPTSPNPDIWEDKSWDEYIQNEGRRERDSENKYDPEEILQWSYRYLANKSINV